MDIFTVQMLLLLFGIGLLLGSLVSYFIMRRVLEKNIESLSRNLKILNSRNVIKSGQNQDRREDLILLADKLKQIENNLQKIRQKEFSSYIDNLNRLLGETGITQITSKK